MFCLLGCFSSDYGYKYGIQEPAFGFAFANIAVVHCKYWPEKASLDHHLSSNAGESAKKELCETFDKKLLESFKGQPFVKGKSPRSIMKLLEENAKTWIKGGFFGAWARPEDCEFCEDPVQFYNYYLAQNAEWLAYTVEFSRATENADALLLPIILYANESTENERGLLVAKRDVEVVAFLIELETGKLAWAGKRRGAARNTRLASEIGDDTLLYPDWGLVHSRLFTDSLWEEFPGRKEN